MGRTVSHPFGLVSTFAHKGILPSTVGVEPGNLAPGLPLRFGVGFPIKSLYRKGDLRPNRQSKPSVSLTFIKSRSDFRVTLMADSKSPRMRTLSSPLFHPLSNVGCGWAVKTESRPRDMLSWKRLGKLEYIGDDKHMLGYSCEQQILMLANLLPCTP